MAPRLRERPQQQNHTPEECPFFVCFHGGGEIGSYPTERSAHLAAQGEVLMTQRRVNIYPRLPDDRHGHRHLGARLATVLPIEGGYRTLHGKDSHI